MLAALAMIIPEPASVGQQVIRLTADGQYEQEHAELGRARTKVLSKEGFDPAPASAVATGSGPTWVTSATAAPDG